MRVLSVGLSVAALLALGSASQAQLPQARLKAIFPPSGQPGTTFEFKLAAGDDLDEMHTLHFSHPEITGALRMQEVDGRAEPVANTFDVTIGGDVPPGIYEVCAAGLFGVTNPRRFSVSHRKPLTDAEPNNTPQQAQAIEQNVCISGKLEGGTDVDCFRFSAEAGQRVVIDCLAERLDSTLTASLLLRDQSGRRLATAHNSTGDDPALVFDVPAAGEYIIELHDVTYRSGSDYVYRLDIHTGPHAAFTMPPAGPAGTRSKFALYGFNLPGGERTDQSCLGAPLERVEVEIDVPGPEAFLGIQNLVRSYEADADAFSWTWNTPAGPTNPLRIGISGMSSVPEAEPNNSPAEAQSVTAPVEIAGQFLTPGDADWVVFAGKPGEVYWIEVVGQRLGSTVDPVLVVEEVTRNAEGAEQVKRLTQVDDDGTNLAPNLFDTFTDDPVYRLSIGQEAQYRVGVFDRYGQTRGGPQLRYRLCIRRETPDFRVIAVAAQNIGNVPSPWPVGLRKGDTVGIGVYAIRKDGYTGPIEITADGLPEGVHCPGTTIGSGETQGLLVFQANENAAESVQTVSLISTAVIDDPSAASALEAAVKSVGEAEKGLAEQRRKLDEARSRLEEALKQRDASALQAQTDPGNAALMQELQQRQQSLDALQPPFQQATEGLAAAEKIMIDARARHAQAEVQRQIARRNVRHSVRSGVIMTPGANNVPAEGRLAQSLTLAVMKETAPFEVRLSAERPTLSQSQQWLIPVQLVKRNGFDEKVTLNVAGIPKNSNLVIPNLTIEKGQDSALLSLFVKENTPPGVYAVWLTSQGQVSHSRNPERTARLKTERDAVAERLKQAQEALQKSTAEKTLAVQKGNEAEAALKEAQLKKTQSDQAAAQRAQERDGLKTQATAAELKVAEAAPQVTAAEQALKALQSELESAPDDEDLKARVAAAEQQLAEARKVLETATTERDTVTIKLKEAERLLTEALAVQKTAHEALKQAEAANTAAAEARTAAEAAEQSAQAAVKRTEDLKKQADKRFDDAEKDSKPQNKNFTPPSVPIVFEVTPAPLKLTAAVPNGGALKPGSALEVSVKIERLPGTTGPVTLSLLLPPSTSGLSGTGSIEADQTEGKLVITATGDAVPGDRPHLVVRGTVTAEGHEQSVDAPIAIKVVP